MPVTVCVDFETADERPDSACQVGLARVEGGRVTRVVKALVRPPRPWVAAENFRVHGIRYAELADQPPFGEVWAKLLPVLAGATRLAAHWAQFDRGVLLACCEMAGVDPPRLPWVCTVGLARKRWKPPLKNKLDLVCRRLAIPLAAHHDAGADAEACARVLIALEGGNEAAAAVAGGEAGGGRVAGVGPRPVGAGAPGDAGAGGVGPAVGGRRGADGVRVAAGQDGGPPVDVPGVLARVRALAGPAAGQLTPEREAAVRRLAADAAAGGWLAELPGVVAASLRGLAAAGRGRWMPRCVRCGVGESGSPLRSTCLGCLLAEYRGEVRGG